MCVASDFIAFRRIEIGDSVHSSFVHSFMLAFTGGHAQTGKGDDDDDGSSAFTLYTQNKFMVHTEKVEKKGTSGEKNSRIVPPVI